MTTAEPLALIDHHVHGVVTGDLDRAAFELLITEASGPPAPGTTMFDSQLGFTLRRWCAPVLDLEPSAPAEDYLRRRAELGTAEVNRRLLTAAGVAQWLVDTGYQGDQLTTPEQLAQASGTPASHVVRLEAVAERVARSGTVRRGLGRPVRRGAGDRDRADRRGRLQVDRRVPVRLRLRPGPAGPDGRHGGRRTAAPRLRRQPVGAAGRRGPAQAPDLDRDRHRQAAAVPRRVRRHRRPDAPVQPGAADRLPGRDRAGRHPGHAAALLPVPPRGRLPRARVLARLHGHGRDPQPRRGAVGGACWPRRSS